MQLIASANPSMKTAMVAFLLDILQCAMFMALAALINKKCTNSVTWLIVDHVLTLYSVGGRHLYNETWLIFPQKQAENLSLYAANFNIIRKSTVFIYR